MPRRCYCTDIDTSEFETIRPTLFRCGEVRRELLPSMIIVDAEYRHVIEGFACTVDGIGGYVDYKQVEHTQISTSQTTLSC